MKKKIIKVKICQKKTPTMVLKNIHLKGKKDQKKFLKLLRYLEKTGFIEEIDFRDIDIEDFTIDYRKLKTPSEKNFADFLRK